MANANLSAAKKDEFYTQCAFNNKAMNANGYSAGGGGAGRPALPAAQMDGTPVGRDVPVAPCGEPGGRRATEAANCPMLCKTHNRAKGNR